MPANKKTPLRMCVSCREMKDKRAMLRVVKNADGQIGVDAGGKAPGRGAYVCGEGECLKKMRKNRALNKAFSCEVPAAVYEEIEAYFAERRIHDEK